MSITNQDCIFCKIINNQIKSDIIYQDNKILVFKDINPEAPVHLLIIPKEHIKNISEINSSNSDIIKHIFEKISELAVNLNINKDGYRVITNCGKHGGQTVEHLHFHVLAGRQLQWPPC